MEKEITVGSKKFVVRELKAVELDDISWDDKKEAIKKQVILSTGISQEDYNDLTVRERLEIVKTINEVNGLDDFQKPTKD